MYETFFGLTECPFSLLPDPDFFYLSPQHKLAKAYLEYGLTQKLGFVVLTGEIGTGKTTLIRSLLKTREGKQCQGVIYQTAFGAEDLLELLLKEFEIQGHFHRRATRLSAFNDFLIKAFSRGEHVVLIVDEAHNLGPAALEELRLLSNIQDDKETLLQVILVGQPGLRGRLRQPALHQLAQRVGVHLHLQPLNKEETKEYIQFRLARAGGSGIFTPSAHDKIFKYSQGVPRRINAWCNLALVAAFAEGRREIDREFLETVVAAQGGTLEGPYDGESASGDILFAAQGQQELRPLLDPNAQPSGSPGESPGNHLRREVQELSARMTRLESLVLDLTSELVPTLFTFVFKPSPDSPNVTAPPSAPLPPVQGPELKSEDPPPISISELPLEEGETDLPEDRLSPAGRSFRKIIGAVIGAGLLASLAAFVIYTSLPGKISLRESEAPGTSTKTLLNSLQEQSPSLQSSPTPQVPQEQPASGKPTGTGALPVPQQDIQSEGAEWSPSISYQVTAKDHGLSKIIASHYPKNEQTGLTAVILANPQITRENLILQKKTLLLPKLNNSNNIIKLNDNSYYIFYKYFYTIPELNKATSMLKSLEIRFFVRETQDPFTRKVYRSYLGGYENENDLKEALKKTERK